MERDAWSIQDVVRRTGVTSRTLRHYDAIGLLPPSFVAAGSIRHYDGDALVRLQRILLLRDLGLSLPAIGEVLGSRTSPPRATESEALHDHLGLLEVERAALDRRIAAVRRTIRAREKGHPMPKEMFDGFDHTQYEEEVAQRWGRDAQKRSSAWWKTRSLEERAAFQREVTELNAAWVAAARAGEAPDSPVAQELAARHVAWLTSAPGVPGAASDAFAEYVRGLADMYVMDDRFRVNYTGDSLEDVPHGPELVRDALHFWAGAADSPKA